MAYESTKDDQSDQTTDDKQAPLKRTYSVEFAPVVLSQADVELVLYSDELGWGKWVSRIEPLANGNYKVYWELMDEWSSKILGTKAQ